jgi:hypothetical protein
VDLFLLIGGGFVQGVTLSILFGYEREIRDGKSMSRFFLWLVQSSLLNIVASPLYVLFPQATLALNLGYYGSLVLISILNYACSIFHKNQIAENSGENPRFTLPYGLHKNNIFKSIVFTLTPSIYLGLLAIGAVTFGLTIASGAYLSIACILGAVFLDQIYQWEWFPSFLQHPYQLLRIAMLSSWAFGLDSWLSIGLTVFNFSAFVWNYVTTQIRGERSLSCQFKIAEPEYEFTFEKNLDGVKPTTSLQLQQLLQHLKPRLDVRITYNHFRDSAIATKKLLTNAPVLNNADYLTLFRQLDFSKPELRELIVNQMAVHDKFHEKSLAERRVDFDLPEGCETADIYIAFLQQEIRHLVERLDNPSSSRSISHEQRLTLIGHSRRVLEQLQLHKDNTKLHEQTLVNLALRTGSHCSRIYLETYAEICNSLNIATAELTLKEHTALKAQVLRDERFKRYYYHVMNKLYGFLDPNDYHSYENFAAIYGQFFYLQNQSIQNRYPDGMDLLCDWGHYYFLKFIMPDQPHFSDVYNETTLIESVISGHLHLLFIEWCNEFYPGAYEEWILDEYSQVKEFCPDVQALAKLMLLDMGLVELTHPLEVEVIERLQTNSHRGPLHIILSSRNSSSTREPLAVNEEINIDEDLEDFIRNLESAPADDQYRPRFSN